MAFRIWVRVLLAAIGGSLLAATGQLGIAYGLGLVRFAQVFDQAADARWAAQLTWVTWFALVAAVAGAVAGALAARRYGLSAAGLGARLALAGAAALGALAVAPLAMQPARVARLASGDPVLTAGLAAGLGALAGLFAALATLSRRPLGWNIAVVVGGFWLVGLLSAAPSLGPTDPLPEVRLGVLDPASLSDPARARLALLTMPVLALIAGVASGGLARARGYPTVVAAGSGAVGPALAALAYLAAGSGGADAYQAGPYWGALIAAGAGALGSVLSAVVRLPAGPATGPGPATGAVPVPAPGPAPDHDLAQPLSPARDRSPESTPQPAPESMPQPAPESTLQPAPEPVPLAGRDEDRDRREARSGERAQRPVPKGDEEYVDWVSGLGGPGPEDDLPEGRRTLRRLGGHQADQRPSRPPG